MAALSAFGLGQPLLQLVSRNSEFLVVHNSQGIDVILLAVALFLIPPVVFSVFVFGAEQIWPQMGRVIHAWILGGLFALTFSPIADQMSGVNGWVTIALIFVTSGFFVFLFLTTSFLRKNLAYLAIAIPVLFLLFMGSGSIRSIVFPDSSLPDVSDHSVKNPVVVVIFDEFPLSSLMKMDQEIYCELFPNFCRLASSSTWYRNATSVSGATLELWLKVVDGPK